MRFIARVRIEVPILEVFAYMATPCCWTEWMTGVSTIRQSSAHPPEVGEIFDQEVSVAGNHRRISWEVTEYEPPRVFACRRLQAPYATLRQVCESVGGSTHLVWHTEEETGGSFAWGPEVEKAITNQIQGDVARLKEVLEARHRESGCR